MRLLKWLFQPAYLLLIIVLVALYVNRGLVFPEEVAESLEAEALVARVDELVEEGGHFDTGLDKIANFFL